LESTLSTNELKSVGVSHRVDRKRTEHLIIKGSVLGKVYGKRTVECRGVYFHISNIRFVLSVVNLTLCFTTTHSEAFMDDLTGCWVVKREDSN
jgi:hypothetical protein